jgi:hypothetical protein
MPYPFVTLVDRINDRYFVFTAVNADGLPLMFPPKICPPKSHFIRNLTCPYWDSFAHPFSAFIPLYFPFEGPLFGRLRFNTASGEPPLVRFHPVMLPSCWRLDPGVVAQWERLEIGLNIIIYLLAKDPACRAGWKSHLEWEDLPQPHWFGYRRTFMQKPEAIRAIRKSRLAFSNLAAMCSYTISLFVDDSSVSVYPGWIWHLRKWVHPGWLEDLRTSVIGRLDGSVKRRGACIYVKRCNWSYNMLASMINSKVPLWFLWGDEDSGPMKPKSSIIQDFAPDTKQVHAILQELKCPPSVTISTYSDDVPFMFDSSLDSDINRMSPPPTEPDIQFPPVEPYSRQRPGQDWRTFFNEQDRRYTQLMETASPDRLKIWEDRR